MKAILEKDWPVAPEGHTTIKMKAGTELEGELAERAIKDKVAKRVNEKAKKTPTPDIAKTPTPDHEG